MTIDKLLPLLCLLFTTNLGANTTPRVDRANAFQIYGVISEGNLQPLGELMLRKARSLLNKPSEKRLTMLGQTIEIVTPKSIDLIINSPGGSVVDGTLFINYMEQIKDSGVSIRCFTSHLVASMAFSVFAHCSERFALRGAYLLWHRASLFLEFARLNLPILMKLMVGLAKTDQYLINDLAPRIGMEQGQFMQYLEMEFLHHADQLAEEVPKFMTVYDSIPGLLQLVGEKSPIPTNVTRDISLFSPGSIIYVAPQTLKGDE